MNNKQRERFDICLLYFHQYKEWPIVRMVKLDKNLVTTLDKNLATFWFHILSGAVPLSSEDEAKVLSLDPFAFHVLRYPYAAEVFDQFVFKNDASFRSSRHLPSKDKWVQDKVDEYINFVRTYNQQPNYSYYQQLISRAKQNEFQLSPTQINSLMLLGCY